MGVRGIDISNHQGAIDVERVVRENNIGFVFVLSNDGTFKNKYYRAQMDGARRGGAIAVPYIYLRTNVDQTYATFREQEPNPGPAIVDVEDGSGARPECDRMHDLLHGGGYTTPVLYWPDWYRKKVGSPSLAGLPPLWTSWYPDYVNRGFDQGLAMVPQWLWNGYGGLPTEIVQFTSSGRLSGYGGNLDLNYYRGTREELNRLIGGSQEGEDMANVSDEEKALLLAAADSVLEGQENVRNAGALFGLAARIEGRLAAVEQKVDTLSTVGVDVQALAAALAGPLGDHVRTALGDEVYNRLVYALKNVRLNVTGSGGL